MKFKIGDIVTVNFKELDEPIWAYRVFTISRQSDLDPRRWRLKDISTNEEVTGHFMERWLIAALEKRTIKIGELV